MFLYQKIPLFTEFMFYNPDHKMGYVLKFSSDLEKIGIEWDVSLPNGTGVDVISDPIELKRTKYGDIQVVKVKADIATDYHTIIKEFWVPAVCVHKVEKNETESSKLRN